MNGTGIKTNKLNDTMECKIKGMDKEYEKKWDSRMDNKSDKIWENEWNKKQKQTKWISVTKKKGKYGKQVKDANIY